MRRAVVLLAALAAVMAVLVPAGLAQRPDDRAGAIGVGGVTVPAPPPSRVSSARPDDRAGPRGPGTLPVRPTTIVVTGDGFDWRDAGVGLLGGLGITLAAAGCLAIVASRRRTEHFA